MAVQHVGGLDLGQAGDLAALSLDRIVPTADPERSLHQIVHLHRWEPGTRYHKIVDDVHAFWKAKDLGDSPLCIDKTGVGAPVVDQFIHKGVIPIRPIIITGGHHWNYDDEGRSYNVPKKDLVAVVQLLLQSGRMQVAAALREAKTLVKELQNFKMKISAAANELFGTWREGEHDDLVLATAMACWYSERVWLGGFEATRTPETGGSIWDADGVFQTDGDAFNDFA
jgi:hypothetical protein